MRVQAKAQAPWFHRTGRQRRGRTARRTVHGREHAIKINYPLVLEPFFGMQDIDNGNGIEVNSASKNIRKPLNFAWNGNCLLSEAGSYPLGHKITS